MNCVLDASATVALLLSDESDGLSRAMLDFVVRRGAVVPPLWRYEVLNALLVALRRDRLTLEDFNAAVDDAAHLAVTLAQAPAAFGGELPLARKFGFTVYDSAYLELAVRSGMPLMTRDKRLVAAADSVGLLWKPQT